MKYAHLIPLAALVLVAASHAQGQGRIYRCGNAYTNDAVEAKSKAETAKAKAATAKAETAKAAVEAEVAKAAAEARVGRRCERNSLSPFLPASCSPTVPRSPKRATPATAVRSGTWSGCLKRRAT